MSIFFSGDNSIACHDLIKHDKFWQGLGQSIHKENRCVSMKLFIAEVIGIISKDTVNPGVSTSPLIFAPFEWTQTDPICNAVWQFYAHSIHKKEGFSFVTVVYTRQIIFWQQQYISDHEFFARKEAALFDLKCFELVNDVFSDTL